MSNALTGEPSDCQSNRNRPEAGEAVPTHTVHHDPELAQYTVMRGNITLSTHHYGHGCKHRIRKDGQAAADFEALQRNDGRWENR